MEPSLILVTQTIAFDAHVLRWSIDSPPEPYKTRHHIKEASFYGVNQWKIDILIQLDATLPNQDKEKLKINYMGMVEKRNWPSKRFDNDGSPAIEILRDVDSYVWEKSKDTVDLMLVGCVGGIATV